MKEYKALKGEIHDIRCAVSPHNHMIIIGQADGHPIYEYGSIHTSAVQSIVFHENWAEVETKNSIYHIMNSDKAFLARIVGNHEFADLTITYLDS